MAQATDSFDLGTLSLSVGEGRRLMLEVRLGDLVLGGETYAADPAVVPVTIDLSKMAGRGYALRLRFEASVKGSCMRCLEPASPTFSVDTREVDQPNGGEDLESPYVEGEVLDLQGWARDSLALALPAQLVCREDCRGLCAVCGANLNEAGEDHGHEAEPDPRWAKLRELRLE